MADQRTQRDEALDVLRKVYPKGSTVYTILRQVSRSGATSQVTLMGVGDGPEGRAPLYFPHYAAAIITGYRQGSWEGHDTLVLPQFSSPDTIADYLGQVLYDDRNALHHRSI